MIKLIPDEEMRRFEKVQWAPMVDLLFIIVIVLATLAITRTTLHNTDVSLVRLPSKEQRHLANAHSGAHIVNLSVNASGKYHLLLGTVDILFETPQHLQAKLLEQQKKGILPKSNHRIKVFLHIDKTAPWQPIAEVILSLRGAGFAVNPVYQAP